MFTAFFCYVTVESGSFAYDFSADLGRDEWKPTSVSIFTYIATFLVVQFKLSRVVFS